MIIYIDKNYKCYTKNTYNNYRIVDVPFFNGKCETFIEGFHFIPYGEKFKKDTGEIVIGPAIFPHKDLILLETIQRLYEEFLVYKQETEQRIRRLENNTHTHSQ